jgi:hypothetical protein
MYRRVIFVSPPVLVCHIDRKKLLLAAAIVSQVINSKTLTATIYRGTAIA